MEINKLGNSLIKSRIKIFLNEVEYNKEFSNTLLKNEELRNKNKEKIGNKDIGRRINLYDKYKKTSNTNFPKKNSEEKKKVIFTKKESIPLPDNNKRSYVNFYERKKGYGYLKTKEKAEVNTIMTQTLTEFIKNKENSTINQSDTTLDNLKDSEIYEDSLEEDNFEEYKAHNDYVNAHKMLIELDKINEERMAEDYDYNKDTIRSDKDINLNDVVLEEDLIVFKNLFQTYEVDPSSSEISEYDDVEDESECLTYAEIQELHDGGSNDQPGNYDFSLIETHKIELEKYLGDEIFSKLYQIVEDYYVFI